ncbi:MAG: flagellar biosynthesis anti-sigma factor FlgM [Tepidanaerobacteraceae bacterium]|nr:flagellar biosynthesis anti-sigma factor FlgM [Tepidanaerobacteraceae bacterium]
MNISRSQLDGAIRTYLKNPGHTKNKANEKAQGRYIDEVKLSEDAQEFTRMIKKVSQTDEVRMDKVAELKAKITTGTYNVDGALVAEKIMEEYFAELI